MAEDTSRRKSNNPSRVLQSPGILDDGDDGGGVQYQAEAEVVEIIPDNDDLDSGDSKDWYGADEPNHEDSGRGFIFRSLDDSAPLPEEMDQSGVDQGDDLQRSTSVRSIVPGRLSLRRHTSSGFSRQRQNLVSYDQPYVLENESNLVRRQQRAVEPFVCRTPSSSGKKDASMQFPDDELAVLRDENDELRRENAELRKKVDRLVETIALNDALPSLLASLRGGASQSDAQSTTTTSSDANTAIATATSSPTLSNITISRCQSLATDDHNPTSMTENNLTSMTVSNSTPITANNSTSIAANNMTSTSMPPMTSSAMTISDTVLAAAGLSVQMQSEPTMVPVSAQQQQSAAPVTLQQISLNQVSIIDQDVLSHVSQQQVQVPRAPVLPVLAPSLPMGLTPQPPMVPPGAPSQLAMIQQSLPSQVPQTMTQTVLSQMARPVLAPVRIRGRIAPKGGDKQDEDTVEITLINNVKVDKRLLDRCNHTNFRKLTSDLLMCLFPRKTLSRSTLGGTSNAISRTTGLPTNKSRLDPSRVEAIIDYVIRVTGVPSRAVKDAIRTKLNNEAKRMHRQLIFKR